MPAALTTKKDIAYEWFALDSRDRAKLGLPYDKAGLGRHLSVARKTIGKWEGDYYAKKLGDQLEGTKLIVKKTPKPKVKSYNSKKWLLERSQIVDEALIESCEGRSPASLKLYKQLTGELIEKSEQKVLHELSADEIARRNFEAERELRQWKSRGDSGQRVEEVPSELSLLPEHIREGEGRAEGDNPL